MNLTERCHDRPRPHAFCFLLDGERFRSRQKAVSPPEIREIVGGIGSDIPIVLCLEDGTQRTLPEDEEVRLERCRHFKKLPRFKRG